MIEQRKRGRPPLFGKAMTAAERRQRHQSKRAAAQRANAPVIPGVMSADEMLARLGYDSAVMSDERIAELRAQPGGADWDDEDQPELGADGEPILPGA
jgi:hypothetical protein